MKRLLTLFSFLLVALSFNTMVQAQSAPKEVIIGASVPKNGVLAAFGSYAGWGYRTAVAEANAKGGVMLKKYGKRVPIKLVVYDDESRPELATKNIERLIIKDGAHALLGSATPPLVISGAVVAEREQIPMVAALSPIRAFLGANKAGWKWTWNMFFDELEMTQQQFLTMNQVKTNKKVALFTDNGPDGVVMGMLWNKNAPKHGYEIVYHAKFPVGTSEYGDLIRRTKEAKAEIIIAQMITPDAIALWKQMGALNYKPKAAFFEKGGEPVVWWKILGKLAQGTMVAGYWHPDLGYPGAKDLRARFEKDTGELYSQHIADAYAAAQVLIDGMENAGSIDPAAVNTAIGKTDKTYVVGPVKFTEGKGKRSAALPTFMLQWQNGDLEVVHPKKIATKPLLHPIP
jgi:branched-chain amino acid transport system substrate-binding protein